MTDEERRIRSYLQAQAAKLAPGEGIDKVRAAMTELHRAALTVPAARFEERPAPEEWSGNVVMAHVVDAGRHFGDQIVAIVQGRPRAASTSRSTEDERHAADAWREILARDREALFRAALAADPRAGLGGRVRRR